MGGHESPWTLTPGEGVQGSWRFSHEAQRGYAANRAVLGRDTTPSTPCRRADDPRDESRPFRAAWWARSGWAQTLLATASRRIPAPDLRLERWSTPDDDLVRVHLGAAVPDRPWVLLLHGLEGSAASAYAREMARLVDAARWNFVALEFRSCGGEDNRRARSYHSGETGDLDHVVKRLVRFVGDAPLCAVGYSLGANVLLKWLGERGDRAPVAAAAAVSTPFDLEVAARMCDRRYGGLIARHFLATLIPKALRKAERFPGLLDAAAIRRCRTFAAFDDLVTAPLHGFADARDYWRTCSSARFVTSIRRPCLLLNSRDDPLVPRSVLPEADARASRSLIPEFSDRGGHCGFVEGGTPFRPRRWAEARVLRFFAGSAIAEP